MDLGIDLKFNKIWDSTSPKLKFIKYVINLQLLWGFI